MFISEFYAKLMSGQEANRLFEALRKVSRLEKPALMATGAAGWAEWPPVDDPGTGGMLLKQA